MYFRQDVARPSVAFTTSFGRTHSTEKGTWEKNGAFSSMYFCAACFVLNFRTVATVGSSVRMVMTPLCRAAGLRVASVRAERAFPPAERRVPDVPRAERDARAEALRDCETMCPTVIGPPEKTGPSPSNPYIRLLSDTTDIRALYAQSIVYGRQHGRPHGVRCVLCMAAAWAPSGRQTRSVGIAELTVSPLWSITINES